MKRYVRKLRHFILFAILIGTDLFIGFYGHYMGSGNNFQEWLDSVTLGELSPVIVTAVAVVLIVEYLFRGGGE